MTYKRADEDAITVPIRKVLISRALTLARGYDACLRATREIYDARPGLRGLLATFLVECAGKLLLSKMRDYDAVIKRETTAHGETQMRSLFKFAVAFVALLALPLVALAQAASMPADLSFDEALKQSLPIITSMKGASALAIAVAVTQLVMKLAQSPLGNLAGKWKLIIVTGVSIVATYLGLVFAGTSWLSALIAGPLLAALQVFAHQLITTLKPTPPPEA